MSNMSGSINEKPVAIATCEVYMRKGPSKSTQEICVVHSGESVSFEGRDKTINNERWIYVTLSKIGEPPVSGWTMAEFYDTSAFQNLQNGVSRHENFNRYRKEGKQN